MYNIKLAVLVAQNDEEPKRHTVPEPRIFSYVTDLEFCQSKCNYYHIDEFGIYFFDLSICMLVCGEKYLI